MKISLFTLAVSNGGLHLTLVSICALVSLSIYIGLPLHWYFLIFSYYLTISNGLSLTTLNSAEYTLCSGSFKWGVYHQFYPGKSENLSSFQVLLLLHRALSFLIRNERPLSKICHIKHLCYSSPTQLLVVSTHRLLVDMEIRQKHNCLGIKSYITLDMGYISDL